MKVVIDANILFSALIKDSINAGLIFHKELEVCSPCFLLEELQKYEKILLGKSHRTSNDFDEFLDSVKESIELVQGGETFKKEAKEISPDRDDWSYFATAMMLGVPIWSNDKALKKQDRIKVINTGELLKELSLA